MVRDQKDPGDLRLQRLSKSAVRISDFTIATGGKWPELMASMELLSEGTVLCPYCGETYSTMVDTSQSSHATIEDCPVCCRPIQLTVECEPGEVFSIDAVPG